MQNGLIYIDKQPDFGDDSPHLTILISK